MRREELKIELEVLYVAYDELFDVEKEMDKFDLTIQMSELDMRIREIKREMKKEINDEICDRLVELGLENYSWDISEVNDEVIQSLLQEIEEWC